MPECCEPKDKPTHQENPHKMKKDWLLWPTTIILLAAYLGQWLLSDSISNIIYLNTFGGSVFELINRMAWGLGLGILFVGILDKIPRDLLTAALAKVEPLQAFSEPH